MVDARIDITGEQCPLTYVKVLLKLEEMAPGQTLQVRMRGNEPRQNLPATLREEGFQTTEPLPEGENDIFCMEVRKPGI
ncbi:MAG: sulfurtransferase TusA family protein [Magnetococcus sp. DMHC-1]|nr:sulfurtransferase TusA family protein [Magnetococcales bacterium]